MLCQYHLTFTAAQAWAAVAIIAAATISYFGVERLEGFRY
jgi:hypothetical protein